MLQYRLKPLSDAHIKRRERDSNPRTCYSQQFSRLPQSTALPSLRRKNRGGGVNEQAFIAELSRKGAKGFLPLRLCFLCAFA